MPGLVNGAFCFGPYLLVNAAFCLSLVSSSLCNFLSLNEDNQARQVFDVRSIGFWCFETEGGRRFEYSGDLDEFDDRFEAARGLGFTANIFGFVIWLVYHAAACFAYPPPVFWVTAFFCFLTCMFEGFKFWLKRSKFFCDSDRDAITLGCGLDTGGKCTIAAVIFWLVAALMVCAHGKERMDAQARLEGRASDVNVVSEPTQDAGGDVELPIAAAADTAEPLQDPLLQTKNQDADESKEASLKDTEQQEDPLLKDPKQEVSKEATNKDDIVVEGA